jgi:DNA repair ATPase RecN
MKTSVETYLKDIEALIDTSIAQLNNFQKEFQTVMTSSNSNVDSLNEINNKIKTIVKNIDIYDKKYELDPTDPFRDAKGGRRRRRTLKKHKKHKGGFIYKPYKKSRKSKSKSKSSKRSSSKL